MHDKQGRAYATVRATCKDCTVEVDGSFTCMRAGERKVVKRDDDGLYIECDEGRHYLVGQESGDGTYYVGLYPVT
jgi:hypothetical protein